ncbi:MAG: hypothetical protein IT184_03005 [Acidobacteria bacterium]|nr:hypothetical protein [Acidobacteriota bacterium]
MPSTVHAQDLAHSVPSIASTLASAFVNARAAEDQVAAPILLRPSAGTFETPRRGALTLRSMYMATAAMQMLDVHSTVKALDRGGVEANPLMTGLVQHRVAFVAAKASVAALTIYAAKRLARNNRVGAIATMVAMNSAYAMIVANNYRIARR